MRRTSLLASAAILLTVACDPTGNVEPAAPTTSYRFYNGVADATGLTVSKNGVALVTGVTFGNVTGSQSISAETTILAVTRASDNFALGSDTLDAVSGKRYTMFGLGTVSQFKSVILQDDTVYADSGKFKIRIVHGVKEVSGFGLDLYVTAVGTDITAITPQVASLQFGAASPYFQNDTSSRRLRVTQAGQTTVLLDTTFAGAFPDSQIVTVVATDKSGGGPPAVFKVIVDRTP